MKIVKVEYSAPAGQEGSTAPCFRGPWGAYTITVEDSKGKQTVLKAATLLNATGRVPNVADIGLDKVTSRAVFASCISVMNC